jgi:peroxiredoxin (alkyl hydroperoxide reductase subunit C)
MRDGREQVADNTETLMEIAQDLTGAQMPSLILAATNGDNIVCAQLQGWNIFYFYPRTSPPNEPPIEGWDEIPGARGCTPQSCAFRDHFEDLKATGAEGVFGVSAQDTGYQKEVVARLNLPFSLLSDNQLWFHEKLGLPIFTAGGVTLYQRVTLVTYGTEIKKVFDPVLNPAGNAQAVLDYLTAQRQK